MARRWALALGTAAALLAPASAQDAADARVKRLVPEILREVVRIRGLAQRREIPAGAMGREQLRAFFDEEMAREFPGARFEQLSRAWAALGLVPSGTELRTEFLNLLQGQVAGFYDPRSERFYLVDESARGEERQPMQEMMDGVLKLAGISMDHTVIAHELTHALQDQHFDLEQGVYELKDDDDRVLAARCLVEGDATMLMNEYLLAKVPMLREMGGALQQMAGLDLDEIAALEPAFQGKPRALWMPLVYPYIGGLQFVQRAHAAGGWRAVDSVFRDLPASSEQVLHPEKYFAERRDAPVRLRFGAIAPAAGWTRLEENTLGELMLGAWLRELGLPNRAADRAAAGWGGDRFAAWALPDGRAVAVLATTWDTAQDAAEFQRVLRGVGAVASAGLHVVVARGLAGDAAQALAQAALDALRVGDAPTAETPARAAGDRFTVTPPGEGWAASPTDDGGVALTHAASGARVVVKRRGGARDPHETVRYAIERLRAEGVAVTDVVQPLTPHDVGGVPGGAAFTAEGDRWVVVADRLGDGLLTAIGRVAADGDRGEALADAVWRIVASVRD